ncbi:MAG TPA: nuclear transport factor 2 family protein [Thermoplasmata archaeon]|nr:nuclear transport factor 2 family protein [Thermoplasmata archaeon]
MEATEITHNLSKAWNTPDPVERRRLLLAVCAPDAEFLSPNGANHGVEEHARGIDIFRKAFPKSRVVHGSADVHHGRIRFHWTTQWNDGRPPTDGVDFGELGADGRIRSLVSFTDPAGG